MKLSNLLCPKVSACSSWLAFAALAALVPAIACAQAPAEQKLREELREWMLGMIESGALDADAAGSGRLIIDEPSRRVIHLGVLVDSASGARAANGLHVIGTTPGGNAERIGLRSGDVLLSVNDVSLVALGEEARVGARAARVLKDQVDALGDNAAIRFEVLRDGRKLAVAGTLKVAVVPAVHLRLGDESPQAPSPTTTDVSATTTGCGRISMRDLAPRSEQLHQASVIRIDGKTPGTTGQEVFRVPAGEHVLEIGERIESRFLGFNDRLRDAGRVYKRLVVTVDPDSTYLVAARLRNEQRNTWKDGAYWEPVIWKTTSERCP